MAEQEFQIEGLHFARNWTGEDWFASGQHPMRDKPPCGCVQAPCGLVDGNQVNPECPEHAIRGGKTMRQIHLADECPAATGQSHPAADASTPD